MATTLQYEFETASGTFRIAQLKNKKWAAMFEDETLNIYLTPESALEEILSGALVVASCAAPSTTELPDDLSDWELIRAA